MKKLLTMAAFVVFLSCFVSGCRTRVVKEEYKKEVQTTSEIIIE